MLIALNRGISYLGIIIVIFVLLTGGILAYKIWWLGEEITKKEEIPKEGKAPKKEEILLKLVTPRELLDLFEDHHLVLVYEISYLPSGEYVGPSDFRVGGDIYVSLRKKGNYWIAYEVSRSQPKEEVFIKGRVFSSFKGNLEIEYGIEVHTISEEKAAEIERALRETQELKEIFVEVGIDELGIASIKRIFIGEESIDLSEIEKSLEEVKEDVMAIRYSKDAWILSSLAQARTVIAYIYGKNNNYDELSCDHPDMEHLCTDVEKKGRGNMNIAKDKRKNSQKVCVFSPLNYALFYLRWYCVDSSGKAGFTHINPKTAGYCVDGVSANCPPFDED